MRYAIDKKPMYYKSLGNKYASEDQVFYTEEWKEYYNQLKNDPDYKDIIIENLFGVTEPVDWR